MPNPSFEDTVACPNLYSQIAKAANWENWGWTPDYFNACALAGSQAGVPTNGSGYQIPLTGNAYAGLIPYGYPPGFNYRELIGAQLTSPLTIGIKYYLSLNVSTGYSAFYLLNCATSRMGLMLFTVAYDSASPPPINNAPHLSTFSIISDSINWVHISGSFIADSAYQYICIGSFHDDSNTDTLILDNDNYCWNSYYYVDDVCVSTDSLACIQAVGIHQRRLQTDFRIYPNPTTGTFTVQGTVTAIQVYDLLGNLVLRTNKRQIDMGSYPSGIYMVRVGEAVRKLILH